MLNLLYGLERPRALEIPLQTENVCLEILDLAQGPADQRCSAFQGIQISDGQSGLLEGVF